MKKIATGIILMSMGLSNAWSFNLGDITSGLGGSNFDAVDMCYKMPNINLPKASICDKIEGLTGDFNINNQLCSVLPNEINVNGATLTKKSGGSSITPAKYCKGLESRVNNVMSRIDSFSSEALDNKYISGKSMDDVYNSNANPKKFLQKENSLATKYFLNGNQKGLRELISYSKNDNSVKDISDIDISKIKAPTTYKDYISEREEMAQIVISDVVSVGNAVSASELLKSSVAGEKGAGANANAQTVVNKIHKSIDEGTANRIGIEIENSREDNDLAIPTQDTINMLREDLKLDAIAKIKEQQIREAFIIKEITQQDLKLKNSITLIAQKTVILNEEFDRAQASEEVDKLLK